MFLRREDGGIGIMFALMMPVVLGFVSLAVDGAMLYQSRMLLQLSADSGALAGVTKLPDQSAASILAVRLANENAGQGGRVTESSDVVFGVYDPTTKAFSPTTGTTTPPNAIRVQALRDASHGNEIRTFFSALMGASQAFSSKGEAIAVRDGGGDACMYLLDTSSAFVASGNSTLNLGCGVQINSSVRVSGNHRMGVSGDKLVKVAGTVTSGLSVTPVTALKTQQPVMGDPLADLREPDPVGKPSCPTINTSGNRSITLLEGCVFTSNITFSGNGTTTFSPGVYYFKNSSIVMSGNHTLKGTGVTLFFDRNSGITMSGNNTIDLAAPSTGDYQGVVLFQSRDSINGLTFSGSTVMKFNGTIYMPSSGLTMSGNSATGTRFGSFVMKSITISGNHQFDVGTSVADERKPKGMTKGSIKLVM